VPFCRTQGERGFSMIEIAIALGVIGFALVAIIGVLPIGLNVQRDNRAETIINQDATYWMEALRGGAQQGADDLSNYVDKISINGTNFENFYLNPGAAYSFRTGAEIIGLLSTPNAGSNGVEAVVRTISGAGTEKATKAADWPGQELAVRYKLISRVSSVNPNDADDFNHVVAGTAVEPLDSTLFDIQLRFQWPIVGSNPRGTRQKTYRSMASRYVYVNTNSSPVIWFYYLTQ
jgi:type II secretory pathway pseudopilin PulG